MINWNSEEVANAIKKSKSWSEALRQLKLVKTGQQVKRLKGYCLEKGISTEHFPQGNFVGIRTSTPFEAIFIKDSSFNSRGLKKKLLQYKLKDYKCEICSLTQWQDKEIGLQVDHINGINTDHRVKNLRFLCPNCHSQTDTWGAKKRK